MKRRTFLAAVLAAVPIPFLPKPKPEPMEWVKLGFKIEPNRMVRIFVDGNEVGRSEADWCHLYREDATGTVTVEGRIRNFKNTNGFIGLTDPTGEVEPVGMIWNNYPREEL